MKRIASLLAALTAILAVIVCAPASASAGHVRPYSVQKNVSYGYQNNVYLVPVAPDYYYSVGDADVIAERVAEKIRKEFRAEPGPGPGDDEVGFEDFLVVGGAGPGLDAQVRDVFDTACIGCHKPGASKPGNIQLLTAGRKLFSETGPGRERRRRSRVYDAVESGDMPKDAPPLTAAQKEVLRRWKEQFK